MKGWVKLHRQIRDHWLYNEKRKFSKYEAWLDLIMDANHKDSRFILGNEMVEVQRGQKITSIRDLCDRWGWSNTKVRNFLDILENDQMILVKSDTKKTLITIVNYEFFQGQDDTETTEKRHGNDAETTQKHTNKNVKNIENEKNEKDKPSSRNKPKVYSEDDAYYQMALYFHEKVMQHAAQNNKAHLVENANLQKWADEFRKIIEIDKRNKMELKQVIDWATTDPFWQLNILSPSKLRGKYVDLAMKMDEPRKHPSRQTKNQEQLDLLRQIYEEEEGIEQSRGRKIVDGD